MSLVFNGLRLVAVRIRRPADGRTAITQKAMSVRVDKKLIQEP